MSSLAAIAERMEQALTRIEATIEKNLAEASASGEEVPEAPGAEVEALRLECDQLRAELQAIRDEHASLRQLADTVSVRLDKAIDELQAALEG